MGKLTITALSLSFFLLTPLAYAQGSKGPLGSGAAGADQQAESTRPEALSGKSGTPRSDLDKEKPAPASASAVTQPPPVEADSRASDDRARKAAHPDQEPDDKGRPPPKSN